MRVLHVVCSDSFAGVERHVALLAATQHDAGKTVAVIGGDPRSMVETMNRPEVVFRSAGNLADTVRQARAMARGADVIHVHMTASELAGVAAALGGDAAVVTTRHFAGHRGSTPLNRSVARWMARRIGAQIAVSCYAARTIEGRSVVVHAGVPIRPEARPAGGREGLVLVAQRFEPEKRTDLALQAFASSGLAQQGWRLLLAGDGRLKSDLHARAQALRIADATIFAGHSSEVAELMDRAAVVVAPRPDEAYGLSVVEAMAAGLPVVAARSGGHLETVGRVPGAALFRAGDSAEAGCLLRALADDPVRRDDYGRRLQEEQRRHFTLPKQEVATDAVYRSLR